MLLTRKIKETLSKIMMSPVRYARFLGVKVGENCRFVDYPQGGSEPYLISVGNHTMISCEVMFITHDGSTFCFRETEKYKNTYKFGPISIGNNCFIGARTIILPNVNIGDNVIIGAGSLVNKNVPSGEVWAGIPAKKISTTEEYAKKCFENRLPYDDVLINTEKKNEMLRVLGMK